MIKNFESTFDYKVIYIFRINDAIHKGLVKIGDATIHTETSLPNLLPNCKELNQAAKSRINSYTTTAGIVYELLHTEIATYYTLKEGKKILQAFRDKKVHNVLIRSGIERHIFTMDNKGQEWFKTDLETAKNAIVAVKNGKTSLNPDDMSEDNSPIIFRPEQKKAIKDTISQFKNGNRMLWNAKMRFGKTLSALEIAKEAGFKKTLIFTHRPVVSDGWFEDFGKIFKGSDYVFGSKTKGETIENLVDTDKPFVYFASIQDLRGSSAVGGKFDKNDFIFLIDWDYLIVDEAHEGTQTTLGQKVLETVLSNCPTKQPKLLELSGTPFNLLANFNKDEIYTWDYIMEQKAKLDWDLQHFGDSNPYAELPRLEIFTYNLDKLIKGYIDIEDSAFNFREFFKTWTGDIKKDFKPVPDNVKVGEFVHKNDVLAFLNLLTKKDDKNNFPFSTEDYRAFYRHTLWMVPGVKEAKALSALMKKHDVFSQFEIVNVAGDGDEEENYKDALKAVRNAIGKNPEERYSVTISCGRLTTGVTVPEWTAVFMLAGSFSTSAPNYLQTIFRVQTPANINGMIKERCSVFDFAPDRTLKMVAEAGHLSSTAGNVSNDRVLMGEFLNFCPVIAINGATMSNYNVDSLLQQLKKAYTDRVVKNGFDDKHLYNDNLLKLDDIALNDFENLKKIIGASKQSEKAKDIDINRQGYTDEEYEQLERIEKKPKKERTPEDLALLEERKQKRDNAQKAMSILRGISIRIPLLVYGAEVPVDKDITIDNFIDIIDDASWNEFMPTGVTKDVYKKFSKYYEQDVFVSAGRQIRKIALSADKLAPTERVMKIAETFSMFKNPDKETVLTPWRVVNMHMSDCLGGYNFFNKNFTDTLDEPVLVDKGSVTKDVFKNEDAKVLEINSKTGLYPLYIAYSIFRNKIDKIAKDKLDDDTVWKVWYETIQNNLFIICKTPMAKSITKRTLLGYKQGKINAHYFEDLIMQLKDKPEQFREKVLRGNFWNRKEEEMKFDAIVGNPPYQNTTGGGQAQATPIYNLFVDNSKKLKSNYISLIIPSRWFAGGMGLNSFRSEMLEDKKISRLCDFVNAKDCFPSSSIGGGVCYFLWDANSTSNCLFTSVHNGKINTMQRSLNKFLTFIRYNEAIEIISKVAEKTSNYVSDIVSSLSPFGVSSSERGVKEENNKTCKLYSSEGLSFIERAKIATGLQYLDKYKIMLSKVTSEHAGEPDKSGKFKVISTIKLLKPNEVCTFSYFVIGCFGNEGEAKSLELYLKTNFVRFLLLQSISSINLSKDKFKYIPLQDFTQQSDIDWTKPTTEIDKQLYNKYNLSEEEIAFIESTIKPME